MVGAGKRKADEWLGCEGSQIVPGKSCVDHVEGISTQDEGESYELRLSLEAMVLKSWPA